ncbi:MAG: XRE family transcriptional regulator [Cloacibacillus sp.]
MKFSETLRNYRKERGWTLEFLAGATKISIAQLSKLETGKSSPSLESLRRLAAAYDVPMTALTHADEVEPISPVRRGDGFVMRTGLSESATIRYLTIKRSAKMQPAVVNIPAGGFAVMPKAARPCDEFFYVMRGAVLFHYGETSCQMNSGDFIYYDGFVVHKWENNGEAEAELIVSSDPPIM